MKDRKYHDTNTRAAGEFTICGHQFLMLGKLTSTNQRINAMVKFEFGDLELRVVDSCSISKLEKSEIKLVTRSGILGHEEKWKQCLSLTTAIGHEEKSLGVVAYDGSHLSFQSFNFFFVKLIKERISLQLSFEANSLVGMKVSAFQKVFTLAN